MWHHLVKPISIHYISRDHPNDCELINHIRPAVARCSRKDVMQVVQNSPCVTNGDHRKFSQDTVNGYDLEKRFPVAKLVYCPRANRFHVGIKIKTISL